MKTKLLLSLIAILFISATSFGQGFTKPAEGKSVIYFINSQIGFGNFIIYDDEAYIGQRVKKTGKSYIRYECDPGVHTFMSLAGAVKSFLTADLKADKIYMAEVRLIDGALGGIIAHFINIKTDKKKFNNKFLPLVNSRTPSEIDEKLRLRWKRNGKNLHKKPMLNSNLNIKQKTNIP